MAPKKAKASNKAETKKKDKIIEDKTFGLKNKNRSKNVQKYVQTVSQSVKAGNKDQRAKEAERDKIKQEKLQKKMKEDEMKKLYSGVAEEKADKSAAAEAAAERGEYLWTADDFDEIEEDEQRLEEQLEGQRGDLVGRTDLTPVTEETFQAWWTKRRADIAKANEKARKAQIKKFKQTGRGISGRALFEHDATIFVDDDDAAAEVEREASDDEESEKKEKEEAPAAAVDESLFDGGDLPDDEEED